MPSVARDESRDREMVLKHHPSISDSGRSSVPMYALPPLLLVLTSGGEKGKGKRDTRKEINLSKIR